MSRKRGRDYALDKNVSRAQRLVKTKQIAQRAIRNARGSYMLQKYRKNLRVSGLIGRFQPTSGNEYKFKDQFTKDGVRALIKTGDSVFYNATPTAIPIVNLIARGTGPNDRIGNMITIKSINFKATVVMGAANPASSFSGSWKVFFILDKQANGSTPAVTDIWAPGTASGTNASISSSLNITNTLRFSILKMFSGNLQTPVYYDSVDTAIGRGSCNDLINFSMKCNIPVKWSTDDSTGAKTAITDNNIWVYAFSDDIGDTQIQLVNPMTRVRFTDN